MLKQYNNEGGPHNKKSVPREVWFTNQAALVKLTSIIVNNDLRCFLKSVPENVEGMVLAIFCSNNVLQKFLFTSKLQMNIGQVPLFFNPNPNLIPTPQVANLDV